jgi:hypothetical protein
MAREDLAALKLVGGGRVAAIGRARLSARQRRPRALRSTHMVEPHETKRRVWTDAAIEAELRAFIGRRDDWPSYVEFVRGGRKALRDRVTKQGGARAWAARLGVRYVERRPGTPVRWTEARIRAELERFLKGRDDWPSYAEFERSGRRPLRQAVMRTGGSERWARELGVARTTLRAGSRRVWDDERIARSVAPLVAFLGRWPTKGEFERAGLGSARAAMSMGHGVVWWRSHFDVPDPARSGPGPGRRVWTDESIEAELRAFCAGRGVAHRTRVHGRRAPAPVSRGKPARRHRALARNARSVTPAGHSARCCTVPGER